MTCPDCKDKEFNHKVNQKVWSLSKASSDRVGSIAQALGIDLAYDLKVYDSDKDFIK